MVAHDLEQTALLEALAEGAGAAATVLYPGCFLHVTPSFFFQHVVYVDRNELAARCFAARDEVLRPVNGRRRYRQAAYPRFVAQDFIAPLPLPERSFDFLLALYAYGAIRACGRYLRPGDLLLTSNFQDDGRDAPRAGLELISIGNMRRKELCCTEEGLEGQRIALGAERASVRQAVGRSEPAMAPAPEYLLFRRPV